MCVPLTLLSAGSDIGATAGEQLAGGLARQSVASGMGALASLASGVVQSRAARADAVAATAEGQAKAKRIRTAGQQEVGRSRGDAVGAGVSLSSGSALDAERQIVRNVEQDALSAIATGESQARALRSQATQAGVNGMLGALAGTVGTVDKWKRAAGAMGGSAGDGLSQGERRQIGVW